MTITIRVATEQDVEAMSRVLIASISQLCVADHHNDPEALAAWTRNKTPEGVAQMLQNPDLTMLVCERETQIVGVGAYDANGTIALNYVAPSARHTGVSTALIQQMEIALNKCGHAVAHLEATATALGFYERQGWIRNGPPATGRRVNGYPMTKHLR